MQRISISLNSLKEKMLEVEKDNMELVEFHIVPSQIEDENMNPAFLHFEGISKSGEYKDYESIDESPIIEYLLMNLSC